MGPDCRKNDFNLLEQICQGEIPNMIHRRKSLSLLSVATLFFTFFGKIQFAEAQNTKTFEEFLSEITLGRSVSTGRVSIASDNIVKHDEPLLVTIDIKPAGIQRDEIVVLHLLMSKGPWPKAYTAVLRTNGGHAHFATRIRVSEDCTLHALAEIDGNELFGAQQEVKVSAGAYLR